jgi:HPt (histidine-containing phosphotransfer) domain-containing protein
MALFQAAHALKSSSAMIGALALSECAKNLEQLGRQGKVTESHVTLAEFEARYETAKQAVQEELGKEAA